MRNMEDNTKDLVYKGIIVGVILGFVVALIVFIVLDSYLFYHDARIAGYSKYNLPVDLSYQVHWEIRITIAWVWYAIPLAGVGIGILIALLTAGYENKLD